MSLFELVQTLTSFSLSLCSPSSAPPGWLGAPQQIIGKRSVLCRVPPLPLAASSSPPPWWLVLDAQLHAGSPCFAPLCLRSSDPHLLFFLPVDVRAHLARVQTIARGCIGICGVRGRMLTWLFSLSHNISNPLFW